MNYALFLNLFVFFTCMAIMAGRLADNMFKYAKG